MGINIVPIPGYQENHEIEGSLSIDMGAIYVDEFVFKTRETRYRFTLAHEMGHIVLHKGIFESVDVGDVADWKRAYRSIDEATYFALEKQAYDFAGLILVPRSHLRERFQRLVIENKARFEEAKAKGILREQALDYFKAQAIYRLARTFIVSPEVMERRIDKDNLIAIIA
jgi:Zn-dependent peptidase ImmA (M78 family)